MEKQGSRIWNIVSFREREPFLRQAAPQNMGRPRRGQWLSGELEKVGGGESIVSVVGCLVDEGRRLRR